MMGIRGPVVTLAMGLFLCHSSAAVARQRGKPLPEGGVLVVPHELDSYQRHVPASPSGMVVSATRLASEVGARILKAGGNAADAAVATAFALAVTWPEAGNLGGGGFCLTKMPGRPVEALDHREIAPLAATRDMYLGEGGEVVPEASTIGWKAVAVPGSPAGLEALHKQLGSLPWSILLEPAEKLAKEGFNLDAGLYRSILRSREKLLRFEESKRIFLPANGMPAAIGTRFVQSELGASLARIAKMGSSGFYEGPLAQAIESAMQQENGLITKEDLAKYKAVWRKPVSATFGDFELHSMPPPSSGGGTLISMIRILDALGLDRFEKGSAFNAKEIDTLVHAMKFAFRDRAEFYGDPDFVTVPQESLLSEASAQWAASQIRNRLEGRAIPAGEVVTHTMSRLKLSDSEQNVNADPDGNTTHFSVADKTGGWVSCTTTLNSAFGSGVVAGGTGIVLNNEMDDFTSQAGKPNLYGLIQGELNVIAAGKRPLSSMTPTLVTQKASPQSDPNQPAEMEVVAALGTPGGPTIINQVLLLFVGLFAKNWDPSYAVAAPRFHHQWQPDVIFMEPASFASDTIDVLLAKGHSVTIRPHAMGAAHIIRKREGLFEAGADPRLAGYAAFPE